MKVSVVIPVYNVKPYLERCVQSVLRQTYKELDIILVDDGSTDGSGELCDQIATRDPRILVIHQKNQGLSGARNTGIRHATGEYVIFIDSDDEWLLDNGLDSLLQEGYIGKDLIIFKNVDIWNNGRRTYAKDYDVENISKLANAHEVFSHLVLTQQFRMSACFLLVRRDLLLKNEIYFLHGYISEDVFWSLQLWQYAFTVTLQNLNFYGYYHHKNSITTSPSIYVYESYDKIFSYWKEQCHHNCINATGILVYLADLWVNRGYHYHTIRAKDKQEALDILKRHSDLLDYANTQKSKRAAKLVSVFGVKIAITMLGIYWQLRTCYKKHAV